MREPFEKFNEKEKKIEVRVMFYANLQNNTSLENLEQVYQKRFTAYQIYNSKDRILESTGEKVTAEGIINNIFNNTGDRVIIQEYDLVTEKRFIKYELKQLDLYENSGYLKERHFIEFDIYKAFVEKKAELLNKQNSTSAPNNTKAIIKSFESTLTDKQLIKLFANLKRDRFIHKETDIEQFISVFRAVAIENIKPIIWLKFKPQLIYMFNELIPTNKVIQPESLYKTLEICFFDKKNKPFKNFKQSNNTQKNITNDIRHAETITAILQKL